ncbi:mRNA cleavage and polyadenylation factor subunit [Myotisia sp. PD_48]|nr:mRNA cleavage and polyadenylation factor subunit [Myotisia sp. PD_48]
MQCYTELLLPSGVTNATYAHFISPNSNNLIVARTSLLQVFSLINVAYGSTTQLEHKPRPDRPQHTRLVLVAEYQLPGTVTGLERVKILNSKSGGDAILVSSRNAKVSLIEWDPERHSISTISIHFFEGEDGYTSPWVPDLGSCPSHLIVDPNSTCAIFNFGIHSLAILPFRQPGDDLVMDDFDSAIDGTRHDEAVNGSQKSSEENSAARDKPYSPSFVLPLSALDPALVHPINLAFLHEYREPTFGILYSQLATSNSLSFERKDVISYAVFTLDLQQRASTTLLTVSRLPSDLFKIVPLPSPIGGALLIGVNEIVHVDQAGKTNAVGTNEFARHASAFSMADQSDLELRLEGCVIEQMGSEAGDMLLILTDGRMAILSFKVDGRSVSGISLRRVTDQAGGSIIKARPSCSAHISRGKLFCGSEEGDSILFGWSNATSIVKKRKDSSEEIVGESSESEEEEEEEEADDDIYDDDLYGTDVNTSISKHATPLMNGGGINDIVFRSHDRLWSLGPFRDIALGKPPRQRAQDNTDEIFSPLELVAARGYGKSGGLTVLRREIDPFVVDSLKMDKVYRIWSIHVADRDTAVWPKYDRYLILAKPSDEGKEESVVYSVSNKGLDAIYVPEFNAYEDCTIDIGSLASGKRVVQVLRSEIRSYDCDLKLAQIYPVWDEDTSDERTVIHSSFAEPYVLTIRDDHSLLLLQVDHSGELDEVSVQGVAASTCWVSGCLYNDESRLFSQGRSEPESQQQDAIFLFLLSEDGKLYGFHLPNLSQPAFCFENINLLPLNLPYDPFSKRTTNRESFAELLVADLGDSVHRQPYIILRTLNDDIIIYEPFRMNNHSESSNLGFLKALSNIIGGSRSGGKSGKLVQDATSNRIPLRTLSDVCGYKTVFMPGENPCFILKSAITSPHILRLRGKAVQGLTGFNIAACEKGFAYVDEDSVIRMSRLPSNTRFDSSWATRKIPLGEQVDSIVYSAHSGSYAIATSVKEGFKLPEDDETHIEWRNEALTLLPQLERGSLKLVDPKTWSIIDSHDMDPVERIVCIKNINLEVSETTHERKDMIVVGTAIVKGEDIVPKGRVYVFEIIMVVPDPDHPERSRRLKLFAKEEVKGAVTAVSGIGGQGFLIVAQGQKCMVRGLKEDGSLLPVAFLDAQPYTNVLKELKGTGMCIIGDAMKGLWFTGYSEEPYKLSLFGKENEGIPVIAADFLPDGDKLYILLADDDCNVHVLQYDPEDPSSSKGDRLLPRSIFHIGHFTSTMTLLPYQARGQVSKPSDDDAMDTDADNPPTKYQVLITSQTGSIGTVTPLAEDSYRRLSALQSQLVNVLEHPCGLNPRGYRAVESDGIGGQRGMIDGNLLLRWFDMGAQRRIEIASRVGADVDAIRNDLQLISGGLAYL